MHAAVTSSDALVQWFEQRDSVVNQIQNNFHQTQNTMVDRRTANFDQRSYDKRKFLQQQNTIVNQFDQTNVDLTMVDSQQTFQQINEGPRPSLGYDDPPDHSVGVEGAPALGIAQHNDMVQGRNNQMLMPDADSRPLPIMSAQPMEENPPAEASNFTSLKKGREFYRDDPEVERKVQMGDKRRRKEAGIGQVQPAKFRQVDPGMVVDDQPFQSAPRKDLNAAAGMPENRLMVRDQAFNQMGLIPEDPEDISEGGRVYIGRVEEALNNFKKIRIRNSEDQGKVGMAAWKVVKTAPTGGLKGEIYVNDGGSKYDFRAGSTQNWIDIIAAKDHDAAELSIAQIRIIQNTLGARKYKHASNEAIFHMNKTYGEFLEEKEYFGMR